MSRECGEYKLRLERSEGEYQKFLSQSKQESSKLKAIMTDIWARLNRIPIAEESQFMNTRIPNESLSSELCRIEQRVCQLSSVFDDRMRSSCEQVIKEKNLRIAELESLVDAKEAEITKVSREFTSK
jgi:hypothetical protein